MYRSNFTLMVNPTTFMMFMEMVKLLQARHVLNLEQSSYYLATADLPAAAPILTFDVSIRHQETRNGRRRQPANYPRDRRASGEPRHIRASRTGSLAQHADLPSLYRT
jgi:hypothetical protein